MKYTVSNILILYILFVYIRIVLMGILSFLILEFRRGCAGERRAAGYFRHDRIREGTGYQYGETMIISIQYSCMCGLGYPISYLHLYAAFFLFLPDFFS